VRLVPLLILTSAAAVTGVAVRQRRSARSVPMATGAQGSAERCAEPADAGVSGPPGTVFGSRGTVRLVRARVLGALRSARNLACVALVQVPVIAALLWRIVPAESTGGQCTLTSAYVLITTAIAMLATASALAAIFFNIPGLAVAIGLVTTVSFVLIPQIKAAIESYDRCRGPSRECRVDLSINTLGQAAMLTAVVAWTAALVLQVLALFHFGIVFLAWLGALELGASEVLKWGGVASNAAAAGVLVGLLTMVAVYEACRNREGAPTPGPVPEGIG
jgi:hypothetical protein